MATPRRPLGEIDGNSRRGKDLTPLERAKIHGAHLVGASLGAITEALNHARSTVQSTIELLDKRVDYSSQPRSGRPKTYGSRTKRKILRLARQNPKWTYRKLLEQIGIKISKSTVVRILNEEGIKKWIAAKRPILKPEHVAKRLKFAI